MLSNSIRIIKNKKILDFDVGVGCQSLVAGLFCVVPSLTHPPEEHVLASCMYYMVMSPL